MKLTDFSSARKEHWRQGNIHGSKTSCNRKTSGIGVNETEEFKRLIEKSPYVCCSKCLANYNRRKSNK